MIFCQAFCAGKRRKGPTGESDLLWWDVNAGEKEGFEGIILK